MIMIIILSRITPLNLLEASRPFNCLKEIDRSSRKEHSSVGNPVTVRNVFCLSFTLAHCRGSFLCITARTVKGTAIRANVFHAPLSDG